MFCAFFSLLMLCGGIGVLIWLAGRRIAAHMRQHPEAAKLAATMVVEHIITPLFLGVKEEEPKSDPADTNLERLV